MSHPAWGAWIEMSRSNHSGYRQDSRTPHGVRGLKYGSQRDGGTDNRRTPHGVRGLKCPTRAPDFLPARSHPAWGAWIEIFVPAGKTPLEGVAPRMGYVD